MIDKFGREKPDLVEGSSNGVHTKSMNLLRGILVEIGEGSFTLVDVTEQFNGFNFVADGDWDKVTRVVRTRRNRFGKSHLNYLVGLGIVDDIGEGRYVVDSALANAQLGLEDDLELERKERYYGVRDDSSRGSDNYDESSFPNY